MTRSMSSFSFVVPAFTLVGLALAVPRALWSQSSVPAGAAVPSLVTSGQGEAKVTPDRVSVLVNVQTRASRSLEGSTLD
jgi:uncharacterized protein YggE